MLSFLPWVMCKSDQLKPELSVDFLHSSVMGMSRDFRV